MPEDTESKFLLEWFKDWVAPPGFRHGQEKTRLEGCCVRLVSDGKGGGIVKGRHYNCPNWDGCKKGRCYDADI